jgi:hypothetical protein
MRNPLRQITVAALVATSANLTSIAKADLAYSIVNYPADQSGATVSGTIVTDGATGALSASDILSWSWTITPSGGPSYTFSSLDANAAVSLYGAVVASSSEITIAGTVSSDFALYDGLSLASDLEYDRDPGENTYTGLIPTNNGWETLNPSMGGNDPWVIATVSSVPEPTTLTMLGIAMVGIALIGQCRKNRADAIRK